jgi:hypothetical protein
VLCGPPSAFDSTFATKAFGKLGYEADRQRRGQIILRQTDPPHRRLIIPDRKELRKGTLIRQAGLSVEECGAASTVRRAGAHAHDTISSSVGTSLRARSRSVMDPVQ